MKKNILGKLISILEKNFRNHLIRMIHFYGVQFFGKFLINQKVLNIKGVQCTVYTTGEKDFSKIHFEFVANICSNF